MTLSPRPLLCLHPCARLRACLREAAGRDFQLRPVGSWAALDAALCSPAAGALAVVDPYHGVASRAAPAPELQRLLQDHPLLSVVAVLPPKVERFADLRLLSGWGVAECVADGGDGAEALSRLLPEVAGRRLRTLLVRALPDELGVAARRLVQAAVEVSAEGGSAEELARRLHVSGRTLLRRCEEVALPPPRQLLAWMRVLQAAELLDQPGRSIASVAQACGYAAD